MRPARRLDVAAGYAFAELDALRDRRRAAGADVIDFGVGDPTEPTPELVIEAARRGLVEHRRSGYPAYHGGDGFRAAAAANGPVWSEIYPFFAEDTLAINSFFQWANNDPDLYWFRDRYNPGDVNGSNLGLKIGR